MKYALLSDVHSDLPALELPGEFADQFRAGGTTRLVEVP